MTRASLTKLRVLAAGLDHPEGVAVDPDGVLWCGGEAGQVYRVDPATTSAVEVANTGGFVLGLAFDAAGRIYACNLSSEPGIVRIDPASGTVEPYCSTAGGAALETPNWAAFAPDGTLCFTDSGTEALDVRNGRLIRVPPGGGDGTVVPLEPLHFPNGMCVDAGGTAYVLETLTPRLSRVVGELVETVADLPGHSPDGVALCADGGFLVSCYYPFRLLYVPPEGGRYDIVLDDPTGIHLPMPTNVAFFGPELESVAIASLGGQVLKAIDLGIRGAPLSYPAVP